MTIRTSCLLIALATALSPTLCLERTAAQEAPGPEGGEAQLPDVDSVLDYLDDLYRSSSSHAVMEMTVIRERGTRELRLESWSRGEEDALIVIREPAREAGTATLRTEDGLWNYAPRADRLIRIPSGLLSESWMGSHFTNDDLVRETSYDEDYRASLSWTEREGERYLQVTLTPRPEAPVVYTELRFLLTPEAWIPVRWEYLDEGELVRVMTFDDVQSVDGKPLPLRMVVRPTDEPDERTVVRYRELELDVPVDADLFTRRGLRRVAGS
ncbi:MAG: outer membrane lipoprotein-sorting protein [Candidatus Palauibacterales bacterium]|nr:outer membrane lipoprotein-sorting protein [Candidatus Palauibacterales bacterium]